MEEKFSLEGKAVTDSDVVFKILDSTHQAGIKIPVAAPIFKAKWDPPANLKSKPNPLLTSNF
jgi:hypothetical protein